MRAPGGRRHGQVASAPGYIWTGYVTRHRRSLVFALSVAIGVFAACRLDTSTKSHCLGDMDCLAGRRCLGGLCASAPAALVSNDAASGDGVVICDSRSPASSCGVAEGGRPLTCFQASALGGQDFCAEACDPTQSPTDPGFACVDQGALLQRCHPQGNPEPSADCPKGLNCYRTNLLLDEGLCVRMPVCATDADCPSATYNRCAATLVTSISSPSPLIHLDHLNCIQANCLSLQTACASSEGCLATQYAPTYADVCAPNCDSDSKCPPNYSCARATSGGGSPNLCLPGLPGIRCNGPHCVVGDCEDTGAGFSICTIPCISDNECAALDTASDAFVCVTGGSGSHCVTPRPFNGANCTADDQCRADRNEFCAHYNQREQQVSRGECRVPCKDDGTCDPQGGLPHTCLASGAGGCYPGIFGVPCKLASECIPPLSCQDVLAETDVATIDTRICTESCGVDGGGDEEADAQCARSPVSGYCGRGSCRVVRLTGEPCGRNAQCQSQLCDATMNTCLPAAHSSGL